MERKHIRVRPSPHFASLNALRRRWMGDGEADSAPASGNVDGALVGKPLEKSVIASPAPSRYRRNWASGGSGLRSGSASCDRFQQRLDAEIDESPQNLIVMGRHDDA
jgi:hypothetical protein